MKRLLLMAPLIALLTGCAHYYYKPGMTNDTFYRDKKECEKNAYQTAVRNGTRQCDEIERCLFAKGYQRK